jgi:hypothetical protein
MLIVLPCLSGVGIPPSVVWPNRSPAGDKLSQHSGVDDAGDPQRPPEGSAALRLRETVWIGVHMSTPARQSTRWVRHHANNRRAGFPARRLGGLPHHATLHHAVLDRDDPQQL